MVHTLKVLESFADAILRGDKNFEVRNNDRGFQRGDIIKFIVLYNSDRCEMIDHPLMKASFEITYVLSGWGLEKDYVVLGIKKKVDDLPDPNAPVNYKRITHGHWIVHSENPMDIYLECSACGRESGAHEGNYYCHWCGAKMGEKESKNV